MGIPLYGQNKDGGALGALVKNTGYKEITTVTAADASHTLSVDEGGIIFINCALASGAVIQLPEATPSTIGLQYRIVFGGTMAAAMTIDLKEAGSAVYAGVVRVRRITLADAVAVNSISVVCKVSDQEKSLELDENDETFGGAIGTDLLFSYVSPDVVFISGEICMNKVSTAVDAAQSTSFTGTGWS